MRHSVAVVAITLALAAGVFEHAGAQAQGQGQTTPSGLPLSLGLREKGSSLTPAFEGWYHNKDGSVSVLVGYLNRNTKQEFDIPVGPNNRLEPGGPDQGQPTHFQPGRQWGVFSVKLPKDFGDKKLTWTLTANGFTNSITLHTKPEYIIEPYEDAASKNTPPVIKFEANGKTFTGPPSGIAATYTAGVNAPLTLEAWVTDEPAKLNVQTFPGFTPPQPAVKWSVFRGPAAGSTVSAASAASTVKFDPVSPKIAAAAGEISTTVTFLAAGDYILRLQANDSTGEGGGGFQCCWTNAHVKVTVKP
ncbi:MAG: hypothetical protein HY048_20280 [Acidobacteria bacterium]|nr:hypothetical protein [Acidobacteriota bacterium]